MQWIRTGTLRPFLETAIASTENLSEISEATDERKSPVNQVDLYFSFEGNSFFN